MFISRSQEEKAHACLASWNALNWENFNGKVHPEKNRAPETWEIPKKNLPYSGRRRD